MTYSCDSGKLSPLGTSNITIKCIPDEGWEEVDPEFGCYEGWYWSVFVDGSSTGFSQSFAALWWKLLIFFPFSRFSFASFTT